jgi:hypothetical protein
VVHLPNKSIRFERNGNNLYVYRLPNATPDKQIQKLNTVKENKAFYTHRQFERAKRRRDLYHALGTPSILDFKVMLTSLTMKILVRESAKRTKFFPSKNGVSINYSPCMIMHQRNLDYNQHCRYELGSYVEAHDEPTPLNSNASRSSDCISLYYTDNIQGGHDLLHLQTNFKIICHSITQVPMATSIMHQVHTLAANEGLPEGLKITHRTWHTFYDHAWLAGVDYHHNIHEEAKKTDFKHENDEEEDDEDNEDDTDIDPETDPDEDEVRDMRVQVDNVRDSRDEDVEDILLQTNSDQNQDLRLNEAEKYQKQRMCKKTLQALKKRMNKSF